MARVLIVEDDMAIRDTLVELLLFEGHQPSEAENGRVALQILRAASQPLVVLMSYSMPVMTGGEAMRVVTSDPYLASFHEYIYLTAASYERFAEINKRLPCPAPYVAKPFDIDHLLATIKDAAVRIVARAN